MTTPSTYRKKPVVVEAMQLLDDLSVHIAIAKWVTDNGGVAVVPPLAPHLFIRTLEGDMLASPGDWIIRGTKGEFYPCKPDVFADVYEAADTQPTAPGYRAFLGKTKCFDPTCPCHPKANGDVDA